MSAEKKTQPVASVATANPKKRKPRKKRVGWFENFRQQWMGMITGIVFSLIVFLIFPPIVHFFFPTAGTINVGKLMKLPLAILCLYIINFTVQVILKRQWKVLAGY
jgi:tetrahydromethanopterin S-methyltransferase subunit E